MTTALEREYQTALERKKNPEPGSYTTYLYDKGLEKIRGRINGSCGCGFIAIEGRTGWRTL